jgi:hypothetical protein
MMKMMIAEAHVINSTMQICICLNQADSRGKDNADAHHILEEVNSLTSISYIGNRKAFPNASSEGLAVCELIKQDKKATEEISNLYKSIHKSYKTICK